MTLPDAGTVRGALAPAARSQIDELEVFAEIDSTNQYLLDQAEPPTGRFRIALADYQTAGRGRRGNRWRAPPSSSICLSIAYSFRERPENLPSLSLVTGVAAVEALQAIGASDTALKWPNDIFSGDAKLGGILVETRCNSSRQTVVIGLGINVDLGDVRHADIAPDRPGPITDLKHCIAVLPTRAALAGQLITGIVHAVQRFDAEGFSQFTDRWNRCDWLKGRQTIVETATGRISGSAEGVDGDGALLVMTREGCRPVISGSVILPATASG